jgi:hypothetical protein
MLKIFAGALGLLIGYLDHIAIIRMSSALMRRPRSSIFLGSVARFLVIGFIGFSVFKVDPVSGMIFLAAFTVSLIGVSTYKALRKGKEGGGIWRG